MGKVQVRREAGVARAVVWAGGARLAGRLGRAWGGVVEGIG